MAKRKLIDHGVNFSINNEITFSIGDKIVYAPYSVNSSGTITWHKPIINAIDIDWGNATTPNIENGINTSGDLINIISENTKSVKLTNEAISSIRTQISSIESSLESINNIIDDSQPLSELRESLRLLSERVTAIEQGNINVDLTEIQNSIVSINERINNLSIPKYVDELQDGYDVLRRSQFEVIKEQLKGDSAYDIAKRLAEQSGTPFPYATEAAWINSLKGATGKDGINGESAFSIAKRTAQLMGKEFPYTNEIDWMTDLINGNETKNYTDQKINELRNELINNSTNLTAGNGIIIENNVIDAASNTWINI